MTEWKPGDMANGHVLGNDSVWRPIQGGGTSTEGLPRFPAQAAEQPVPAAGMASATNPPATVSLVFGIISPLLNLITILIPSIVAIITGIVGLGRAKRLGGFGRNKSIWGIATGAAGAVIAIVVWTAVAYSDFSDSLLSDSGSVSSDTPTATELAAQLDCTSSGELNTDSDVSCQFQNSFLGIKSYRSKEALDADVETAKTSPLGMVHSILVGDLWLISAPDAGTLESAQAIVGGELVTY